MLLTAAMASCEALLVGALIDAPDTVDPTVVTPGTTLVVGLGAGVMLTGGVGVGRGVGITTGGTAIEVSTVIVTEAVSVLALPAASVKLPAATEITPSAVLLAVGVKVAV